MRVPFCDASLAPVVEKELLKLVPWGKLLVHCKAAAAFATARACEENGGSRLLLKGIAPTQLHGHAWISVWLCSCMGV